MSYIQIADFEGFTREIGAENQFTYLELSEVPTTEVGILRNLKLLKVSS